MPQKIACVQPIATRLRKSITAMAQQQRPRPAGVLHGAPLLLCLALLMLASEAARSTPGENYRGRSPDLAKQADQEVTHVEDEVPENSALLDGEESEEDFRQCVSFPDSTTGPCVVNDHRFLADYSPPESDRNSQPGGPLP